MIYIVIGEDGYEDYAMWLVAAYSNKSQAEKHVKLANEENTSIIDEWNKANIEGNKEWRKQPFYDENTGGWKPNTINGAELWLRFHPKKKHNKYDVKQLPNVADYLSDTRFRLEEINLISSLEDFIKGEDS